MTLEFLPNESEKNNLLVVVGIVDVVVGIVDVEVCVVVVVPLNMFISIFNYLMLF